MIEVDSQIGFDIQKIQNEQKRIVDQAIRDDRIWSRFTLVVAVLGVSILLLGVGGSFLGLTSIAIVEVAGGSITSAVSILVYRTRRDNVQRIDKIYEKQVQAENIRLAFLLLRTLHGKAYERMAKALIEKLIGVQPEDGEIPKLPEGSQSNKKTPQLPTNQVNDTNT